MQIKFFYVAIIIFFLIADKVHFSQDLIPNKVIINFKEETVSNIKINFKDNKIKVGIESIDEKFQKYGVIHLQKLFSSAEKTITGKDQIDLTNYYILTFSSPYNLTEVINDFKKDNLILSAEPDMLIEVDAETNDSYKNEQWALTKVNAINGWNLEFGSSNIVMAIIDTGVDWDHPDLAGGNPFTEGNIWINWSEYNGTAGVDDDGNGYIDDIRGWDFVTGASGTNYNSADPNEDGEVPDNNPLDFYGHGTHVAGIAGAITNNSAGIAGISGGWHSSNRGSKIMCLRGGYKARDGKGYMILSACAAAIDYARAKGVDVINCSWLSTYLTALDNAITNAINSGIVIVKSAGNENIDTPDYINGRGDCISVVATNQNDQKASFSNYGTWTDVSAPGEYIYSTIFDNSYGYKSGTSMATPMVTGLVSLIKSIKKTFTVAEVTTLITSSADNIDNQNPSYQGQLGSGRINIQQTLLNVLNSLANLNQSRDQTASSRNNSRHLVKDAAGYYHMVFSSGGEIFYRKSTNGGYNWSTAIRISAGNGYNKYPCITLNHYYGIPSVTWQRETQANTYEIYFAASRDNGNTWNTTDRHVVASLQCPINPSPVIQGTQYGTLKVLAFKYTAGIFAYTTTNLYPASSNDWQVFPVSTTYQEDNVTLSDDWAYYKTLLAYQDGNPANIKYTFFDGTSWFTPYSLSSIVPGTSIHQTPTIANNPNGSGVHIAWERITNSGSSATDHTIIYRRANSYNDWRNEYYATYYQGQQLPSITCTDLNEVYLLFQLIPSMGNEIYKQFFNGSSWGTPTLVASNSVYPSVSKGKTDAKYIYTTGVSQPYTVTVSSDFLSKQNEQINFNNYSRSIAIMNNPDEYLEVVLNKVYFKMKDGSKQKVDFIPADLEELKTKEKFDLTPGNAWDLMKGMKDLTIPVGADELVFDYTVRGENIDKVIEDNPNKIDLSIDLNITAKTEKAEKINSMDIVKGKITETKFSDVIQLNSVNAERGFDKIEIGLKVKGLTPKTTAFASLGHIFDYTNTDTQNETIASKLNHAEAVSEETLTSENYPNPFNPTTLIRFTIKNSNKVTLKVYDVLGREVAELLNSFHEAGSYEIPFNGTNLPSGVYFYHLTSNGDSITKKMLLLK